MFGCSDVRMCGCADVWMCGCADAWMWLCDTHENNVLATRMVFACFRDIVRVIFLYLPNTIASSKMEVGHFIKLQNDIFNFHQICALSF